ncbi:hypothetical protein RF11_13955 [Thelohanellus kitauei]|uniref:Uncharacterized protein n=1 Tax=Thelohanellus kitauei TaxID=669202 RepID=A0A0C2IVV5_THEKT|nr:hypothetical protein RF11_13955 [Thelohanellus kitauei]
MSRIVYIRKDGKFIREDKSIPADSVKTESQQPDVGFIKIQLQFENNVYPLDHRTSAERLIQNESRNVRILEDYFITARDSIDEKYKQRYKDIRVMKNQMIKDYKRNSHFSFRSADINTEGILNIEDFSERVDVINKLLIDCFINSHN